MKEVFKSQHNKDDKKMKKVPKKKFSINFRVKKQTDENWKNG